MDDDESQADARRHALLELSEELAPLYEFAAGQRALLEAQGWSAPIAEQIAASLLAQMLQRALTPPTPGQMLASLFGGQG